MSDNEHNPDPNANAARIVSESTDSSELPADIEAAWAEWSKGIQKVDERGMTLLKAAFECLSDVNSFFITVSNDDQAKTPAFAIQGEPNGP